MIAFVKKYEFFFLMGLAGIATLLDFGSIADVLFLIAIVSLIMKGFMSKKEKNNS
ncbi:MAG: hypothetical protein L7S62_05035 [Flavobacteriales bacterium]|nr:hypothetical protein [Flavobacteriales bacterium]